MTQRTLSLLLRGLAAATALAVTWAARGFIVLVREHPLWQGQQQLFPCFLVFFLLMLLTVYAALFLAWRIFSDIGRDRSFSLVNARRLSGVAWLLLAASVGCMLLAGGFELLAQAAGQACGLSDGLLLWLLLAMSFVGLALTLISASLSHLVRKAALLQQENELTV